jgi:hypothetical protein
MLPMYPVRTPRTVLPVGGEGWGEGAASRAPYIGPNSNHHSGRRTGFDQLRGARQRHHLADSQHLLSGTISELATRRSEFAAILRSTGIEGLITSLNKKGDDLQI